MSWTNHTLRNFKHRQAFRTARRLLSRIIIMLFSLTALTGSLASADFWFLGVGNDGYINDVDGIYNSLMQTPNWQSSTVHERRYTNRTGSQIVGDLAWFSNAQEDDVAIFYYSGHGSFSSDSSGEEMSGWALDSFDETIGHGSNFCTDDSIANALSAVNPAVTLVTIFDTCYAGGMVGGTQDLNTLPNVFAMLSSSEDQVSYGGDPLSNFTDLLVQGITGPWPADSDENGIVTLNEWFYFAGDRIVDQTPINFDAADFGSTPIASVPEPTSMLIMLSSMVCVTFMRRRN